MQLCESSHDSRAQSMKTIDKFHDCIFRLLSTIEQLNRFKTLTEAVALFIFQDSITTHPLFPLYFQSHVEHRSSARSYPNSVIHRKRMTSETICNFISDFPAIYEHNIQRPYRNQKCGVDVGKIGQLVRHTKTCP
jgi:hypothetical protein